MILVTKKQHFKGTYTAEHIWSGLLRQKSGVQRGLHVTILVLGISVVKSRFVITKRNYNEKFMRKITLRTDLSQELKQFVNE